MKPVLTIIASVVCTMMVLSCQHQGAPDANRDKDEEHDLVVAQELSNSRVQGIAEDAAGTRAPVGGYCERCVSLYQTGYL